MRYRRTIVGIAILFSIIPFFASAVTVEELTAQVQGLLTQLAALQTNSSTQNQISVHPALPAVLTTPNYCPSLQRTLSRGSQGTDVRALQGYLILFKLLSADSNSGFFGPLTENAVRNWQQEHAVVSSGDAASTGWGVVGVRTRAAIAAQCRNITTLALPASPAPSPALPSCPIAPPPSTICSTGWQANTDANGCTTSYRCAVPLPGASSNVFSASPPSGTSPLSVTFSTNIQSPTSYAGGEYKIDYGDSSVEIIAGCSLASVCSLDSGTHRHAYTASGVYTARLLFFDRTTCTSSFVGCISGQQTVASLTITVDGSTNIPAATTTTTTTTTVSTSSVAHLSVSFTPATVARGQTIAISWESTNIPAGSKIRLEVWPLAATVTEGNNDKGIGGVLAASGSYTWTLPSANAGCTADSGNISCISSGQYKIVAKLYSGNECWGFCSSTTSRTIYVTVPTSAFTVTQ